MFCSAIISQGLDTSNGSDNCKWHFLKNEFPFALTRWRHPLCTVSFPVDVEKLNIYSLYIYFGILQGNVIVGSCMLLVLGSSWLVTVMNFTQHGPHPKSCDVRILNKAKAGYFG